MALSQQNWVGKGGAKGKCTQRIAAKQSKVLKLSFSNGGVLCMQFMTQF